MKCRIAVFYIKLININMQTFKVHLHQYVDSIVLCFHMELKKILVIQKKKHTNSFLIRSNAKVFGNFLLGTSE